MKSQKENPDITNQSNPTELFAKATALHQAGHLNEAEAIGRILLTSYPENAAVPRMLGTIQLQRGRLDEAMWFYDRAIAIAPDDSDTHHGCAVILYTLKRYDDALAKCDKAIACNPHNAEAHNTRATILRLQKKYSEALASSEKAIVLQPDAVTYNSHGLIQMALGQPHDALASFGKAISIDPHFAAAYCNRGRILHDLGQHSAALMDSDQAIALNPRLADAYWNKALIKLQLGEYEEGWKLHEWRWKRSGIDAREIRTFPKPLWLGKESLSGKTILLRAEQGFGDALQFCRYVPMVEALGAHVILESSTVLIGLMSASFKKATVIARESPPPEYDFHCPLMSLPLVFGTTLTTVPAQVPYLFADTQKQNLWRERLGEKSKPRVGLVWSGSATHTNDHNRSIPLSLLTPLLSLNADFYSLQKDVRFDDQETLANSSILILMDDVKDFTDTTSLVAEMDLIISVDTSVVHLAGSLGKPVWVMLPYNPDFRWLLNREDSPWYPTARLFRQQRAGDWESVIDRVKAALLQHVF